MILPTRRKFITRAASLLAAPFIIKSSALGWTHGVGPSVKPNGTPTLISSALSADMLVYAFDTGSNVYNLPYPNTYTIDPPTYWGASPNYYPGTGAFWDPDIGLVSSSNIGFGTAINWPGPTLDSAKPGTGTIIQLAGSGDPVRTAFNLNALGSGAGFTIGATWVQTGVCSNGWIFGRGYNIDVYGYFLGGLLVGGGSATNVTCGWPTMFSNMASGSDPQTITSANAPAMNALHTVVVSFLNTSAGITTVTMYLDGVQEAQAVGTTVYDLNYDAEDQIQLGCLFHVAAGQSAGTLLGQVMQGWCAARAWSAADAANIATAPYQMLLF